MFFQIVENTFVWTRLFCWWNVFIQIKNWVFVIFGDWSVEQIYNTTTMFADSSNQICFSQFIVSYHVSPFCNFSQFTNSFTFLRVHYYIFCSLNLNIEFDGKWSKLFFFFSSLSIRPPSCLLI